MTQKRSHLHISADDYEWREAPDGIRYVRLSTDASDPTRPLSILSEYPPNHRVEPHTHGCDYMEMILDGELTVGKAHLVKGDIRIMKAGVGYGPLISGSSGCRLLIVFDRADGSPTRLLGRAARNDPAEA